MQVTHAMQYILHPQVQFRYDFLRAFDFRIQYQIVVAPQVTVIIVLLHSVMIVRPSMAPSCTSLYLRRVDDSRMSSFVVFFFCLYRLNYEVTTTS